MNYSAKIIVKGDKKLLKCLEPEAKDMDRSSLSFDLDDNDVRIKICAKDATAFRATINSVTQLLSIYEKARGIGDLDGERGSR